MSTNKIAETFDSVNDSVTVYRFDNGWMLEVTGRDKSEEWITRKIVCPDLKNLLTLLETYSKIKIS